MKDGIENKTTPGLFNSKGLVWVCRLLNKVKAKYLVVGGYACNLHGLIRATKDIDLLIPKDVRNTEAILKALAGLGFGISRELDPEEVSRKPMTIIGDTPRVDLLTVANKVKFEQANRHPLCARIDHEKIPFVNLQTLIKTKETDRLQDKADIERLMQIHKRTP